MNDTKQTPTLDGDELVVMPRALRDKLVAALDNLNHLMTRYDCPFGKPLTDKSDCTCNYHDGRKQAHAVLAKVKVDMTRAELIAALMETQRTAFSNEPENADFPAAEEYLRSLTTKELQWMYEEEQQ